jgi:CheY-like chemotaxis protein
MPPQEIGSSRKVLLVDDDESVRELMTLQFQSAGSTRLDHDHLEFYLSAFLSAARSVTVEHQAWWGQWKASQSPEDVLLLKRMKEQRDSEVHQEGADVSHQVEDIPASKIKTPPGSHAAYAPSFGDPFSEVKIGVKVA